MTQPEIEKAIEEINKPGSIMNTDYKEWCNNVMTNVVANILNYLSQPDQTIKSVPNITGDSACTILGYVSGRSHSAADMIGIDKLQQVNQETLEDDYKGDE